MNRVCARSNIREKRERVRRMMKESRVILVVIAGMEEAGVDSTQSNREKESLKERREEKNEE